MRMFHVEDKVNFVDDHNVFVGYDMGQSCCESANWLIAKEIAEDCEKAEGCEFSENELSPYSFDKEFFEKHVMDSDLDGGDSVAFKLVAENLPDLYLTLWNCHNGYYSHGFEAKIGGVIWEEGYL
jgi:hypothetical protein